MPITFVNAPATAQDTPPKPHGDLATAQGHVRDYFGLPPDTKIEIGMTTTTFKRSGVSVILNFGLPHVQAGSVAMVASRDALVGLFPASVKIMAQPPQPAPVFTGPPPKTPSEIVHHVGAFNPMSDEEWVVATAQTIFTNKTQLSQATMMHQTVYGTSKQSVYRTCFIGPHLKGAARIMSNQVSFRFTTDKDECPTGMVQDVLKRLGVTSIYADRMTGHSNMEAPFEKDPAAYHILFGAYYAALRPFILSPFPSIKTLAEGVK